MHVLSHSTHERRSPVGHCLWTLAVVASAVAVVAAVAVVVAVAVVAVVAANGGDVT